MSANSVTPAVGTEARPLPRHVDVLVVGAGISGIGMACHLTTKQPGRTFAVLDGRAAIGGTWDLFRYPGIRSDSDLHTFGYEFKPWTKKNAIADAHEIMDYLHETIDEYGLADRIHLGHKVISADFANDAGVWTVTVQRTEDDQQFTMTCGWLFSACGYYDYDGGYSPAFEGQDDFAGQVVHPQAWPENLDYTGKKVVVIGSGATAVTLIPAIAEQAGHVTMLQRSPTYVMSLPKQDPIANTLNRLLPEALAYRLTRRLNIKLRSLLYTASQRYPDAVRRFIRHGVAKALPADFDVDTHFNPHYNPWEQRLCVVPDGDLFAAISRGTASVVTDRIQRFTERGVLLAGGEELQADIIVTATGLQLLPYGGIALSVDGQEVDLNAALVYKALMLSGVPNFAFAIGYTNSSWTLKVDLVAEHLCRLLAHMDRHGHTVAVPVDDDPSVQRRPLFDFGAGYVQRTADLFPLQGSHGPWTMPQSYAVDRDRLRHGPVEDPALRLRSTTAVTANDVAREGDPAGVPA